MISLDSINETIVIVLSIIIVVCSLGIIVALKFDNKQKKKYKECLRLIKEKENGNLPNKNELNNTDNNLIQNLYDVYLNFISKINNNDKNFNNILDDFISEFYKNKIDIYNSKNYFEITENIELINYSILEYDNYKLKFRINITCFNYKKRNEEIISGSKLERVEQILILTYIKSNDKWLISNIEKVFEKKLSA